MTKKIEATKITISRGEGPISECGIPYEFTNTDFLSAWDLTNAALRKMSDSCREGSDKVDFWIEFENEDTYNGTYYLQKDGPFDLAKHILDYQLMHTGEHCPSHMTQEQYEGYMNFVSDSEGMAAAKHFVENFQIG